MQHIRHLKSFSLLFWSCSNYSKHLITPSLHLVQTSSNKLTMFQVLSCDEYGTTENVPMLLAICILISLLEWLIRCWLVHRMHHWMLHWTQGHSGGQVVTKTNMSLPCREIYRVTFINNVPFCLPSLALTMCHSRLYEDADIVKCPTFYAARQATAEVIRFGQWEPMDWRP